MFFDSIFEGLNRLYYYFVQITLLELGNFDIYFQILRESNLMTGSQNLFNQLVRNMVMV